MLASSFTVGLKMTECSIIQTAQTGFVLFLISTLPNPNISCYCTPQEIILLPIDYSGGESGVGCATIVTVSLTGEQWRLPTDSIAHCLFRV